MSNEGVIPKSLALLCKILFVFGDKREPPLPLTLKPRFFYKFCMFTPAKKHKME